MALWSMIIRAIRARGRGFIGRGIRVAEGTVRTFLLNTQADYYYVVSVVY